MECLPIVQDDFPPDYKSVREMLRTKISTCNAVVHLAGFVYGAEPQPVLPGPDRRSFTQMEYEIAMELKLPTYVFLCGRDFPFDPHDSEAEDKQRLQLEHRERLLQREELFYEFATREELSSRTRELQLSVENLRSELARERRRRLFTLAAALAAVVIAGVGGVILLSRQQVQDTVIAEQSSTIATLQSQLEGQTELINRILEEQKRLGETSGGSQEAIAQQARENVAAANSLSLETLDQTVAAATETASQLAEAAAAEGDRSLQAEALEQLGNAQAAAGQYGEAIETFERRLALLDRDADPVGWAWAINDVAFAKLEAGAHVEAARLYSDAHDFVSEHPDVGFRHPAALALMGGLATAMTNQGAYEKAIPVHENNVEINEELHGPDSPSLIAPLTNLGIALMDADRLEEAAPILERALDMRVEHSGEEDPQTLSSMSNFATVLRKLGDLEGAESLQRRALAGREELLGSDHPDTLISVGNLAIILKNGGDTEQAEALYRRAIDGLTTQLGPAHPFTLQNRHNLALMLKSEEGGAEEAETLFRANLEASSAAFHEGHIETQTAKIALAELLHDTGQTGEAALLFEEVYRYRAGKLGEEAPETLQALERTANAYWDSDQLEAAVPLYLTLQETQDLVGHEDLAMTTYNLALLLTKLDRFEEALPFARQAVALAREAQSESVEKYQRLVDTLQEEP